MMMITKDLIKLFQVVKGNNMKEMGFFKNMKLLCEN